MKRLIFGCICLFLVAAKVPYTAASVIIISQTHHVWGQAPSYQPTDSYDYTDTSAVSGYAEGFYYDYDIDEYLLGTATSTAGDFSVVAETDTDPPYGGWVDAMAGAESTYVFVSNTTSLDISLSGSVCGTNNSDIGASFTLTDLTSETVVDDRSTYDFGRPEIYDIVWGGTYQVELSHQYELWLYAKSSVNDSGVGYSLLSADIEVIPEPTIFGLLVLGAVMLRRKRRSFHSNLR